MSHYVTFATEEYRELAATGYAAALRHGSDRATVYEHGWLDPHPFRQMNSWLWDHEKQHGYGYYAWKPLVILDAMTAMHEGEVVLYADADTEAIADLTPLYNRAWEQGVMLFSATGHVNRAWTKRDCYIAMGLDEPRYHDAPAGCARYALFRKGSWLATQILSEWLAYTVNPRCNSYDASVLGPELNGFHEHRWDQSVLTLLAHKYGVKLYREPDQHGEGSDNDRDLYPTVFRHTDIGHAHEFQTEWSR